MGSYGKYRTDTTRIVRCEWYYPSLHPLTSLGNALRFSFMNFHLFPIFTLNYLFCIDKAEIFFRVYFGQNYRKIQNERWVFIDVDFNLKNNYLFVLEICFILCSFVFHTFTSTWNFLWVGIQVLRLCFVLLFREIVPPSPFLPVWVSVRIHLFQFYFSILLIFNKFSSLFENDSPNRNFLNYEQS